MRYAIEKKVNQSIGSFRYWNNLDELILNDNDSTIFKKPKICEGRFPQDKSLIIRNKTDNFDLDTYLKWKEIYADLTVAIDFLNPERESLIAKIENAGLRWFFSDYCYSQDMFTQLVKFNISQIYIVEELGFQLKDIKNYFNSNNREVKIRVIPNIGQTRFKVGEWNTINKFFIRPEDTRFYEPYVDTFELVSAFPDRYSVIFEIYKKENWDGYLQDIIGDITDLNINNRELSPYFGAHRLNCYKKCTYNLCSFCSVAETIANTFDKAQIEVITPKKEMEIEFNIKKEEKDGSESNERPMPS